MAQRYRFHFTICTFANGYEGRNNRYMETINWKVEGMSCPTCALTIGKYLEKKGGRNVKVSLASGDVSFDLNGQPDRQQLQQGISDLGYTIVKDEAAAANAGRPRLHK